VTQFKYEEWHLLWKAVEARASFFWAQVERIQIEEKKTGEQQMELWGHFLELAEEQTYLLNKIESMANERFPILEPFPKAEETYPNEGLVDLDEIKLEPFPNPDETPGKKYLDI